MNIINKRFGRLTVLELSSKIDKHRRRYHKCLCDCGTLKEIANNNLTKGITKSCGCLIKEIAKINGSKRRLVNPGDSGLNHTFSNYKAKSKKLSLSFDLSVDEFRKLTSENCAYCGDKPSNIAYTNANTNEGKQHSAYTYNGIDRLDSTKGYTLDNVTTSCAKCNRAKLSMSRNEFKEWIKKVYNKIIFEL